MSTRQPTSAGCLTRASTTSCSRPRRFGKSLFLDTCKELFEGLDIHDHWDWSVRHPVLRLSFGSGNFQRPDDLRAEAMDRLEALEVVRQ